MKIKHREVFLIAIAAAVSFVVGCGDVSGNTYQSDGGAVQLEFQSGGKANLTLGPLKQACTYAQDSKSVAVTCDGDKTIFTINGDILSPPPGNMIGPMTKKK